MKKRITTVLLGFLFVFSFTAVAQSNRAQSARFPAKKSDVQKVKERTLLVALTGSPGVDESLKKVIPQIWDFSETEFVAADNIASVMDGNKKEYAVLSSNIITIKQAATIGSPVSEYLRFAIRLAEKYQKRKSIYYQDVIINQKDDNIYLEPREVYVGIYKILNHYEAKLENEKLMDAFVKNAGKLEKRTLLIQKDLLDKGITKSKIAEIYPYPFELVEPAKIDKAVMDQDEKYAFVHLVPVGTATNMMMHEIYDCKDGQILTSGEANNGAFDRYSNLINKDHLKAYVKNYDRLNRWAEKRK
ncbi:hypothetical protein QYS49_36905 [Marivirga salinae]|uniref:DUF302 domain-containing protein n=1 Tax=Marivirga salinarum TaxID=3059078 RepID=A0AA51RDS9_9BACT|nr:hypothetical protein [Marivirga sp. BDSF4-3]WMN11024.1 hypothetical protein QYS49_36905 [Marivirga sp. BDSF4-3]